MSERVVSSAGRAADSESVCRRIDPRTTHQIVVRNKPILWIGFFSRVDINTQTLLRVLLQYEMHQYKQMLIMYRLCR